ncbi:MAG: RDD family protein [Gallionella sp.]|nr:RDD family protein [Gallionella sp.]MCK9352979.1 RDD family protein [Gallionella sp.]
MTYAGFWRRFAALWLDVLIMSPLMALAWWGKEHLRLFDLYYLIPATVFGFFYGVYLVQRFGGTPGKRLMKVSIVKVNGEPVTYREALLRYLPEWLMSIGSSIALIIAALHLTDAQYFSAPSFVERMQLIKSVTPSWYGLTQLALNIWIWSEFIVMLTNKKRRAIHDFIAGTVVIKDAQPDAPRNAPQAARA